jgi:putative tricarboxylic transport membrane protein
MKSLDKSELIAALLLIALGAFVAIKAWDWPYLTKDGPGPGFFPLWIGGLLVGLSVLLIALQYSDARKAGKAPPATNWKGARPVLVGWVALMVAVALLKPAGFAVAYALLAAFLVRVVFRQSWFAALMVSVVSAAAFWLVFAKLLRVQIPAGPWGF